MYCTHYAAIRVPSKIGKVEWIFLAIAFGNLATKLLRAPQGQMEAIARMRRGGEQTIRYVHVDNRGGRPSLLIRSRRRQNAKVDDQSHATGADRRVIDEERS